MRWLNAEWKKLEVVNVSVKGKFIVDVKKIWKSKDSVDRSRGKPKRKQIDWVKDFLGELVNEGSRLVHDRVAGRLLTVVRKTHKAKVHYVS